jgi:hypothetical protein
MAHPLIVAEATTEHFGALMGPSVDHGARQYMRMAGLVKRAFCRTSAGRASVRSMRGLLRIVAAGDRLTIPCRQAELDFGLVIAILRLPRSNH